ncbi:MAG: alpha-amylase family glycosyl hydrolase [Oscillospiraceae bacterium]|nr:alpha-amylase family glycosyl hydrolase [Oscillospiraceae bacterium]
MAPRYGTNEDLASLFQAAHEKGMHVLLDLVPGHTSDKHPWFKESCRHEKNEYTNRYIFTDAVTEEAPGFRYLYGVTPRDGNYMVNFFSSQPALNYGFNTITHPKWQLPPEHPDCLATVEALKDVMRFWLDMGADGFRVDMAFSLIKNDEKREATSCIWCAVRQMLDNDYPNAALLSEWCQPEQAIRSAGFHMDFAPYSPECGLDTLFRNWKNGEDKSYFSKTGRGDIAQFMKEYERHYKVVHGLGYICPGTCNHDTPRMTKHFDVLEIKLAYALIFTLPGIPFLYYGDELGMRYIDGLPSKEGGYDRTGTRTPMQWDGGSNLGFSNAPPEKLYLPVDSAPDAPTVENQKNLSDGLYRTIVELISLRHQYADLSADGSFEVIYAQPDAYPFVYRRGRFLLFVNPSADAASLDWDYPAFSGNAVYQIGNGLVCEGGKVTVSPQSFVIIENAPV